MIHATTMSRYFLVLTWLTLSAGLAPAQDAIAKLLKSKGADVVESKGIIMGLMIPDGSKLTDDDFQQISRLGGLKTLSLSNGLNNERLAQLTTLTELEYLQTNLAQITDDGVKPLARLHKLKNLKFFHPGKAFSGAGLVHLAELPNLHSLTVAGSLAFNDEGMAAVARLMQLKEFRTWHAGGTDEGVKQLRALKNLKSLFLGQRLTYKLPACPSDQTIGILAEMTSLESLQLEEARLTFAALEQLKKLPALKKLKLGGVDISKDDVSRLEKALPQVKIERTEPNETYQKRIRALFAGTPKEAPGAVIATMDEIRFQSPKEKAKAELIEGKIGKAVQFQFDKDARSVFFTSNIRGSAEWDKAAGFSFWVKGDGKDQFGGLQFIYDNDFAVRYDFVFPIKGSDWTKVTVAWQDLLPVLAGPRSKPLTQPSKLSSLWIGRWWYWGDYPALTFAIDDIRLEPTIERDTKDYRPEGHPLARVAARLKAGQPITVVTMGDSLTDVRHWANRKVSWPGLLQERVQAKYRSEVAIVNPAIGGTELRQNLVLMPRWLAKAPEPDLVTICFGGNDWNSGMRGDQFQQTCVDAIDRVRRATRGKADVLILTTVPNAAKWETMAELADACRKAAQNRNAGLADTEKAFHVAGQKDRDKLYVSDRVHLSPAGHELVADAVLAAIEAVRN